MQHASDDTNGSLLQLCYAVVYSHYFDNLQTLNSHVSRSEYFMG